MGYCMYQTEESFCIKKENFDNVLQALKEKNPQGIIKRDKNDFENCRTIFEAFDERCWNTEVNEDGNIDTICFIGEKAYDDVEFFNTFAQFVEKDSYIQMCGEDSSIWRWIFNGESCKEISPTISWG